MTDIFNPLTLDSNLISPYNFTAESNIEVMRIKEMIIMHAVEEALDCERNSLCQHLGKCIENSMENLYTDAGV